MKITKDGVIIAEQTPQNALTFADLNPGDIFRYARGKEHNIYVFSADGVHTLLNRGQRYYDSHTGAGTYVIRYPNAKLELGEEEAIRSAGMAAKKNAAYAFLPSEDGNDLQFDDYYDEEHF